MERRFAARGWKMPEVNRRQAWCRAARACSTIRTAPRPGLWIEHGERDRRAAARAAARDEADDGRRRARTAGARSPATCACIGGWFAWRARASRRRGDGAADLLAMARQSPRIETTILAGLGQVELHLSTQSDDAAAASQRVERGGGGADAARSDADIVSRDGAVLEAVVGELLRARGWRIAFAESCTGGLATSRMTDIAGSSAYVERSVVAYSNGPRSNCSACRRRSLPHTERSASRWRWRWPKASEDAPASQVGVGITGIAGPGGGSEQKPVGTVCIAVRTVAIRRCARFVFQEAVRWSKPCPPTGRSTCCAGTHQMMSTSRRGRSAP